MVLVDTTVWIAFLRGHEGGKAKRLLDLLEGGEVERWRGGEVERWRGGLCAGDFAGDTAGCCKPGKAGSASPGRWTPMPMRALHPVPMARHHRPHACLPRLPWNTTCLCSMTMRITSASKPLSRDCALMARE
uniref:PIN domain-containing protein n=1 Tax=Acidithiobacillus sulfuriphilus TaxID=1867749 RepID=A0A3M8S806_9PROT|nr:hypothetical protein EC580_00680 [Acidithiobacillus sulfuriphilus]